MPLIARMVRRASCLRFSLAAPDHVGLCQGDRRAADHRPSDKRPDHCSNQSLSHGPSPLNSSPPTGNFCLDGAVFVAEVDVKANSTGGNVLSRLRVVAMIGGEKDRMVKTTDKKIRVWDVPVRLFHWTLVVLLTVSYFTGRAGGDWMKFHFWSGYAILTLLLFRIAWGFVGSTTARFSDFVKGPMACIAYLRDLLLGRRHLRCRPQSGGWRHGRAAYLRGAAQVVAGLFSADNRHGHRHRSALRAGRRQVESTASRTSMPSG